MKPSSRDHQLGLASPLNYVANQSGNIKSPSKKEAGLDVSHQALVSREGRGENCFLDIPSPKTLSRVNRRDLESKFGGSFSEQLDLLLAESFLIVLGAFVDVGLTVLEHAIHKSGESMCHSGDGLWSS